jgi:hypothetical protein
VPADTRYIVMRAVEVAGQEDGAYAIEAVLNAGSARDALHKTVTEPGTYVAVPARSWKPVQVRTETQTVIRLDTPKEAS